MSRSFHIGRVASSAVMAVVLSLIIWGSGCASATEKPIYLILKANSDKIATAMPEVVATPKATAAAVSLATKTVATTASRATAVSQPCPTADQARYFSKVGGEAASLADGLDDIGTQFRRAGSNPMLILSDSWRLSVTLALFKVQVAAEAMQSVPAPRGAESIDRDVKAIASESIGITNDIARAIDDLDESLLARATQRIRALSPLLTRATKSAENFCL